MNFIKLSTALSNLSLGLGIAIKLDDKDNDEGGCDRDCEGNEVRIVAVF